MSDPKRLLDTASPEADLLGAWSSMRAPTDARAKALALAGVGGAAIGAAAAAKAAAATKAVGASVATGAAGAGAVATTGAGLFAAKVIAAVAVVAAVGGGAMAVNRMATPTAGASGRAAPHTSDLPTATARNANGAEAAEPPNTPAAPQPPSTNGTPAAELPNATPVAESPNAKAAAEPPTVKAAAPNATVAAAPKPTEAPEPVAPPAASTLAAEVSSLDTARNALRGGDPARALRELDAFDTAHPQSPLTEDAAFLRFDASVALGDRAGATKAARTFLAKYPQSPRSAKVRRWLDAPN